MPFTRQIILAAMGVSSGILLTGSMASLPAFGGTEGTSTKLRIGVIGAGWLGGTVAELWVKAGHEVMFSSRHPDELKAHVKSLGSGAHAGLPAEAAKFGSILLFAVPYNALVSLGRELNEDMKGKIILDACNPPNWQMNDLAREAKQNGVGITSQRFLPGTRLVRAFSAVDAMAIEASAERKSNKLGVPLASDDREALQVAARLVVDAGCEPVIIGNMDSAKKFQRGGPGFRANTNAAELRRLMELP